MAKNEIKVNGSKLRFFNKLNFSTRIDTIASSISFESFIDYDTFAYSKVEVVRNDILIFTGEIIDKTIPQETPPKPFTYKAESLPHILSESTIPTKAYPLQLENSTLKDIVEFICSFFEITVIFDQSAASEAAETYKLSNLGLAKEADKIINELVTEKELILTHNAFGELIITKDITQSELLLPRYLSNNKKFNLKKFFHNYIALGQAPIGQDADIQAIASFDNIDERRNTTKIQKSGGVASIESKAAGMRSDSLKSIQQGLSFDNFFCNVGDYIILGDLKLIINQLNYNYDATSEIASIGVVDSQIYER